MKTACFITAVLLSTQMLTAQTILLDVGDHTLKSNTPNQTISMSVTGGAAVQGVNLLVQMGDGGAALGGVDGSAPAITDITLITGGMIFEPSNTGHVLFDPPTDQFWQIGTTTDANVSSTVSADGLLAVLTIDTTGFTSGTFDLKAGDIQAGGSTFDSDFAGLAATITNGSVTVPEPIGVWGLLALALAVTTQRSRGRVRPTARCTTPHWAAPSSSPAHCCTRPCP